MNAQDLVELRSITKEIEDTNYHLSKLELLTYNTLNEVEIRGPNIIHNIIFTIPTEDEYYTIKDAIHLVLDARYQKAKSRLCLFCKKVNELA